MADNINGIREYKYKKWEDRKYVRKWCSRKKGYYIVPIILLILTLFMWMPFFINAVEFLSTDSNRQSKGDQMMAVVRSTIIPWVLSYILPNIYREYIEKIGEPFGIRKNKTLRIYESRLEYSYQRFITKRVFVYTILFDELNRVTYEEDYNVLTLTGVAEKVQYEDNMRSEVVPEYNPRVFFRDSRFSFILAFEEKEEIIALLKSKQKKEGEEPTLMYLGKRIYLQ